MSDYLFYLLLLAPKVAKRCRGEPCSPTDTPCTSPLQTFLGSRLGRRRTIATGNLRPPKSQGGEAYVSLCLYLLSIFFFCFVNFIFVGEGLAPPVNYFKCIAFVTYLFTIRSSLFSALLSWDIFKIRVIGMTVADSDRQCVGSIVRFWNFL